MYQPKVQIVDVDGTVKEGRLAGLLSTDHGDIVAIIAGIKGLGCFLKEVHPSRLIFIKEHRDD